MGQSHKRSETYFLSAAQLAWLRKEARRAQRIDQREVCGLILVNTLNHLSLSALENRSRSPGAFELHLADVNATRTQLESGKKRVLGSFHSHPISEAVPSAGDRARAFYLGVELIYDVCADSARLWRYRQRERGGRLEELMLIVGRLRNRPAK